jgi:hypothetical protein
MDKTAEGATTTETTETMETTAPVGSMETTVDVQRAGIEGAISQGVRAFGLRQARYRGLRKTHLQDVATATAMDLTRLHHWREGDLPATTRRSRFARLAVA